MDTERRHLHRVEVGERLPVPADDLEFLDHSARVNAAGLRQELHEPPSDWQFKLLLLLSIGIEVDQAAPADGPAWRNDHFSGT